MKRIISAFLMVAILAGLLWVPAFADSSATLTVSSASAKVGEQFTVTVGVTNNTGIGGFDIAVTYDESVLKPVKAVGEDLGGGTWTLRNFATNHRIMWADYSAEVFIEGDTDLAVLTFEVIATEATTTQIGLSVASPRDVSDMDGNSMRSGITVQPGTITIIDHEHDIQYVAKQDPSCDEDGWKEHYECSICHELYADAAGTVSMTAAEIVVAKLGHDYGAPAYDWADDFSSVTASRVCSRNDEHVETETVTPVGEETTPATCVSAGVMTYTATFENTAFTTQTKTAEISVDPNAHDYEFTGFTWTGDDENGYTAAQANYVCNNDEDHTKSVDVTVTSTPSPAATCEEDGQIIYSAILTSDQAPDGTGQSDSKVVTIPALDHDYKFVDFTWSGSDADGWTAVANYKCEHDETHTQTVTATMGSDTTPATCETAGKTVYSASVSAEASLDKTAHTADPKEVVILPTGHDFQPADKSQWVWADDYSSVTVPIVCQNEATHPHDPLTVNTTFETTPATCEAEGNTVYTVTFSFDEKQYSDTREVKIDPLSHDYKFVDFTWTGDDENGYTAAVANYVCEHDATHTETVAATVTSDTTDAECEKDGKTVYTAKVTAAEALDDVEQIETKEVVIDKLGHAWQLIDFTWTGDDENGYTAAVANFVCEHNTDHTTPVTAVVTLEETKPTCTEDGVNGYKATATLDGQEYTDVKGVVVLALDHDYKFVGFTWTGDDENGYTAAVANYVCSHDATHTATVAATVTSDTTDAECEKDGKTVYTAKVTAAEALDDVEQIETKEVVIDKLGHDWEFVDFTWTGSDTDGWTAAVANYKCRHEATHTDTVTATVTPVITPATCEEAGQTVYTAAVAASASLDKAEHSDAKTVVINALNHKWGEPVWTWNDDNTEATATITCENDHAHVQTATTGKDGNSAAAEDLSQFRAATATSKGQHVYNASVTLNGTTVSTAKTVEFDVQYKTVSVDTSVNPIPDEDKAKLDEAITAAGYDPATAVYSVWELLVSYDDGATWAAASKAEQPADGIDLTLDAPAALDGNDFIVVHGITDDATPAAVVSTETLTPTKDGGKLTVHVKTLSPFAVAYKASATGGGSNTGSGSNTGAGTKSAPRTGDDSAISLWTVVLLGSTAGAALVLRRKRED